VKIGLNLVASGKMCSFGENTKSNTINTLVRRQSSELQIRFAQMTIVIAIVIGGLMTEPGG